MIAREPSRLAGGGGGGGWEGRGSRGVVAGVVVLAARRSTGESCVNGQVKDGGEGGGKWRRRRGWRRVKVLTFDKPLGLPSRAKVTAVASTGASNPLATLPHSFFRPASSRRLLGRYGIDGRLGSTSSARGRVLSTARGQRSAGRGDADVGQTSIPSFLSRAISGFLDLFLQVLLLSRLVLVFALLDFLFFPSKWLRNYLYSVCDNNCRCVVFFF